MREKTPALTGRDAEILFTPGRGRNTWTVYFSGESDKGESAGFIYRLNISSLPFGLRYLKMYDSVLSVLYMGETYVFERDYGDLRKKKQLSFDKLFFEGNSSRLQGNLELLDLAAYITGSGADVAMDFEGRTRITQDLAHGDIFLKHKDLRQCLIIGVMDCQGLVSVGRKDHNVVGTSLMEKKYLEFPKGRVGKPGIGVTNLYLVSDDGERVFRFYLAEEYASGDEEMMFSAMEKDKVWDAAGEELETEESEPWESPHTGNVYYLSRSIKVPSLETEITVWPEMEDQEVFSGNKKEKTGEYIGIGRFEGKYRGEILKGACFFEIS